MIISIKTMKRILSRTPSFHATFLQHYLPPPSPSPPWPLQQRHLYLFHPHRHAHTINNFHFLASFLLSRSSLFIHFAFIFIFFLLREARYGKKIFRIYSNCLYLSFFFCEKPNTGKSLSIHSNCLYRFISLESFPSILRSQIWKNNSLVIHSAFRVHLLSICLSIYLFWGHIRKKYIIVIMLKSYQKWENSHNNFSAITLKLIVTTRDESIFLKILW